MWSSIASVRRFHLNGRSLLLWPFLVKRRISGEDLAPSGVDGGFEFCLWSCHVNQASTHWCLGTKEGKWIFQAVKLKLADREAKVVPARKVRGIRHSTGRPARTHWAQLFCPSFIKRSENNNTVLSLQHCQRAQYNTASSSVSDCEDVLLFDLKFTYQLNIKRRVKSIKLCV